ncbi:MAG: BatD family protein [Puniceicoccales bacterium]|nr:BatD family protein [Puniceicoccales bacterium]
MKMRLFSVFVAFLQIAILSAKAPDIDISARFEPDEVDSNSEVRYIVNVANAFPDSFHPPVPNGLHLRNKGVYQSSSIVNGVGTHQVSFVFSYVPQKTGTFEIPAYEIKINGKNYIVPSTKVKVADNLRKSSPRQNSSAQKKKDQVISLNVSLSRHKAYVGQNIPVTITIKCDHRIQLIHPVKMEILGDAFLRAPLPERPKSRKHGQYEIYTWNTFITPLKSGTHEISFQAFCSIQILHRMSFLSFAEEEPIDLISEPVAVEVFPLPEAPTNFCGSVGQFTLKNPCLSSDRVLLGEPVTLTIDVEGQGNFARLQPPEIANSTHSESWKVFPPKSTFIAYDDYNFKGKKTIEYVLIPQKTGEIVLPDIVLTYFNPETERFETSTLDNSKKIVLVSRSAEAFSNDTRHTPPETKANHISKSDVAHGETHILSKDTRHGQTLMPISRQRWFWILQGCFAAIALFFFFKIKSPSTKKKTPKWNMKNIQKCLSSAINKGEIMQFYKIAFEAIDQKLALHNISLEQSRAEQIEQLQSRGLKHLQWLEAFLNEGDAIAFGQRRVDTDHLQQQLKTLLLFLQQH